MLYVQVINACAVRCESGFPPNQQHTLRMIGGVFMGFGRPLFRLVGVQMRSTTVYWRRELWND